MPKRTNKQEKAEKMLQICKRLGETLGIDTPSAIRRYIATRKTEVTQEIEKIRKVEKKIEKLQNYISTAEDALALFWSKETSRRKRRVDK